MQKIIVLPHQSEYMQVPYLFPEKRWFFFVCGYGSGKTKANVIALLYAVKKLQNKKDRSGDYARLMVAGYTLAHLNKTFLVYLRQILDQSKSQYTENKKDNYFVIGTVTVFIVPMENPENIFGMDIFSVYVEEVDELTEDKAVEAVRALSERCRQQIPGFRSPFLCLASTAQGQKGLYRIYNHFKKTGTGFVLIRGRTEDNPFLPASLIQDMKKMYSPEEKRVFMDAEFLAIAKGRVLGDFSRERNYLDYDLDTDLRDGETVYVGMDFNCHAGWEKVSTIRGEIPIKDVVVGDYVLTRQGYRKVLAVLNSGKNGVARRMGVFSTRGHNFITPEGDVPQWKVKNYYYLPKRNRLRCRFIKILREIIASLPPSVLTDGFTGDTVPEAISFVKKIGMYSIGIFGSSIMGLYPKEWLCIIKTVLWTTVLSLLYVSQERSMRKSITRRSVYRRHGSEGRSKQTVFVLFAVNRLLEISLRLVFALTNVKLNSGNINDVLPVSGLEVRAARKGGNSCERVGMFRKLWVKFVTTAALVFKGRYCLATALYARKNVMIAPNGEVRCDVETDVYDLSVEGVHEYFVGGVLSHNTGFNRASVYVVREGVIYCIKYYDFPDPQDAPAVFRHDFPTQRILWIPDVTIKDSFPQFARELRKYDIQIIYRKKNPLVEDTVFLANKLFYTGRLMICKIAKDVAEACALAMRDKDNKIPKGSGPSSPIHTIDGLRYVCAFVCMRNKDFRDIRTLIIDKRASFRSDSEKPVQDLGGGYMQIHPNALYRGKKL
jgi:hypothetical protein